MNMPMFDGAACQGMDINLFFTEDNERRNKNDALLKKVCANCVCLDECFTYALNYAKYGWWGGMGETERNRLRKKLGITITGTTGMYVRTK